MSEDRVQGKRKCLLAREGLSLCVPGAVSILAVMIRSVEEYCRFKNFPMIHFVHIKYM